MQRAFCFAGVILHLILFAVALSSLDGVCTLSGTFNSATLVLIVWSLLLFAIGVAVSCESSAAPPRPRDLDMHACVAVAGNQCMC